MKIIFIAGPYTSGGDGTREYFLKNIKNAEQYAVALANKGIGFFCPHTHTMFHNEKGGTAEEEFYYNLDLAFLYKIADAVLAVPGWERSFGAKREIEWAQKNDMPVFFPKDHTDLDEIIKWVNSK